MFNVCNYGSSKCFIRTLQNSLTRCSSLINSWIDVSFGLSLVFTSWADCDKRQFEESWLLLWDSWPKSHKKSSRSAWLKVFLLDRRDMMWRNLCATAPCQIDDSTSPKFGGGNCRLNRTPRKLNFDVSQGRGFTSCMVYNLPHHRSTVTSFHTADRRAINWNWRKLSWLTAIYRTHTHNEFWDPFGDWEEWSLVPYSLQQILRLTIIGKLGKLKWICSPFPTKSIEKCFRRERGVYQLIWHDSCFKSLSLDECITKTATTT